MSSEDRNAATSVDSLPVSDAPSIHPSEQDYNDLDLDRASIVAKDAEDDKHDSPNLSHERDPSDETKAIALPPQDADHSDQTPGASIDGADSDSEAGDISLGSPKTNKSAPGAASSHRRIDSVPPQMYDLAHETSTGLSVSLASTALHSTIEEEESDISVPHHDDSTDPQLSLHSPSAFRSFGQQASQLHPDGTEDLYNPPAIDKADLNFVDITLDASEAGGPAVSSSLDPHHPLAGSTKTAEQIRSDSLSSQNLPNSSSVNVTQAQDDSAQDLETQSMAHDLIPPPSPHSDEGDVGSAPGNRSVEGRYRGRRSAASSRAASPTGSPSRSPSRRASFAPSITQGSPSPNGSGPSKAPPSLAPAPVLLAADEHGNISVVLDMSVSPRTVPAALPAEDEQSPAEGKPTSAQAEPRPTRQDETQITRDGRAATSLSDEVKAEDAAEASKTSTPEPRDPSESTLSVPPSNGDPSTSNASPGLSDKADQVDSTARRKASFAGASSDPVESRTRMTTLPAKTKTEEIKHRADFERMMMAAKEVERRKREEEEERKRRRQDEQREALGRWEKEILPSWSRARKDPELAKLWWKGAPPSIRGRIWALAIGNPLMLPRNLLEQSERKAAGSENKPIEDTIPMRVLDQIDEDVQDTLPSLKLFQQDGPLHDDLVRLCRAFVLVRMEQVFELDTAGDADRAASRHQNASPLSRKVDLPSVSDGDDPSEGAVPEQPQDDYARRGIDLYQPGLASLAAVLLINMSINTAFIALLNLLNCKPWLKALYSLLPTVLPPASGASTSKPGLAGAAARQVGTAYSLPPKEKAIRGFERVLETLLADQMPKVYANLLARNVKLYRIVLRDWVSTLWTRWLDVDTVMRLWDVVLLDETDSVIYRVCLALVQTLESRLYVPDQEELESVLRGTNKAALAIWRRDKEQAGELDVHMRRPSTSPRQSRGSLSSAAASEQVSSPPSAPSSSSLASNETQSQADPTTVASPPPRSSSLAQMPLPQQQQRERQGSAVSTSSEWIETITPRDYIYEQYGIKEDHIFDTLEAQQSWWKQSTLQRLLDRELSE